VLLSQRLQRKMLYNKQLINKQQQLILV